MSGVIPLFFLPAFMDRDNFIPFETQQVSAYGSRLVVEESLSIEWVMRILNRTTSSRLRLK